MQQSLEGRTEKHCSKDFNVGKNIHQLYLYLKFIQNAENNLSSVKHNKYQTQVSETVLATTSVDFFTVMQYAL